MTARGHVLIVVAGLALTVPTRAYAVNHVVLDISPARIVAPVPAAPSLVKDLPVPMPRTGPALYRLRAGPG